MKPLGYPSSLNSPDTSEHGGRFVRNNTRDMLLAVSIERPEDKLKDISPIKVVIDEISATEPQFPLSQLNIKTRIPFVFLLASHERDQHFRTSSCPRKFGTMLIVIGGNLQPWATAVPTIELTNNKRTKSPNMGAFEPNLTAQLIKLVERLRAFLGWSCFQVFSTYGKGLSS